MRELDRSDQRKHLAMHYRPKGADNDKPTGYIKKKLRRKLRRILGRLLFCLVMVIFSVPELRTSQCSTYYTHIPGQGCCYCYLDLSWVVRCSCPRAECVQQTGADGQPIYLCLDIRDL